MGIIDELLTQQQTQPPPDSWVQGLIDKRYQPKTERLKRSPVGFQFKRDPFDPSSYYNELGTLKNVSRSATAVVEQEAANRANTLRQQEYEQNQNALRNALGGINPQFTGPGASLGNLAAGTSRKYGLKGITATTSKAADYFGSKYGIKTIGGYREHGSVPGSDHPKGRALDYMINNLKNGSATGTALANDAVKNYKAWNIKYVMWNRYIWTPSRGWHKYSGPSPHTDYVHISFNS